MTKPTIIDMELDQLPRGGLAKLPLGLYKVQTDYIDYKFRNVNVTTIHRYHRVPAAQRAELAAAMPRTAKRKVSKREKIARGLPTPLRHQKGSQNPPKNSEARRERKAVRRGMKMQAANSTIDDGGFEEYVIDNPQLQARAAMRFEVPQQFQTPHPVYPVNIGASIAQKGATYPQFGFPSFSSRSSALHPNAMHSQQSQGLHGFSIHSQAPNLQDSPFAKKDMASAGDLSGCGLRGSAFGGSVAHNTSRSSSFVANAPASGSFNSRSTLGGSDFGGVDFGGRAFDPPGPASSAGYSWTQSSTRRDFLGHVYSSPESGQFVTPTLTNQENLPGYLPSSVSSFDHVNSSNIAAFEPSNLSMTYPLVHSPAATWSDSVHDSSAWSTPVEDILSARPLWNLERASTLASLRNVPSGSPLGGQLKETPLGVRTFDKNAAVWLRKLPTERSLPSRDRAEFETPSRFSDYVNKSSPNTVFLPSISVLNDPPIANSLLTTKKVVVKQEAGIQNLGIAKENIPIVEEPGGESSVLTNITMEDWKPVHRGVSPLMNPVGANTETGFQMAPQPDKYQTVEGFRMPLDLKEHICLVRKILPSVPIQTIKDTLLSCHGNLYNAVSMLRGSPTLAHAQIPARTKHSPSDFKLEEGEIVE